MRIAPRTESFIGSLIAAGAMVYAVHLITKDYTSLAAITLPRGGPMEISYGYTASGVRQRG